MLPRIEHGYRTALACAVAVLTLWMPSPCDAQPSVLTLDDALARARAAHPALVAAQHTIAAAKTRADAAGKALNPSLSVSVENVGGSLGGDQTETSFLIEQPLELGGDRDARKGAGQAGLALSEAERDALGREIDAEVFDRTIEIAMLQERVWKLRAAEELAARAVRAADERRRAGAAPAHELTRANGFSSLRSIDRRRAEAELGAARDRLSALWGGGGAPFDSVALVDPAQDGVPPLDSLRARLVLHPRLRRASAATELQSWQWRQAKAERVPDVSLGAGVQHLAEVPGTGFEFAVSLPLPLWNGGGAEVEASEAELFAARAMERREGLELRADLDAAYARFVAAVEARDALGEQLVPASSEALRQVAEGYRSGRLGSLEIQEAQRSLLEAELQLVDANAEVWRARGALASLAGPPPGAAPAPEVKP